MESRSARPPSHGGVPAWGAHVEERSPICQAPFVAMEFDPFGDVQACCANALYPLGNVGEASLADIWHGPRAEALRERLRQGDLSLGCSVCRYRLTYGHGDLARDYYDLFPEPADGELWPFSLQFSLHNTCNLACVMCGADRSSKIRSRRSHLPPLPQAYGDRFFAEIGPFLEHAGAVDFSGGEPFLVTAHHRIWDQLLELERPPLHSLTTNGTVWDERVERVLDGLDTHIAVSVDGMTPATFEAIRVGASFREVMANLDRFLAYTRERGTILTLGWSLVQSNWHELGAAARFADERDIDLKVHTVIEPEFGVQQLPTPQLAAVVHALEREGESLTPTLGRNRAMWEREVGRLRAELELRARPGRRPVCMEPAHPGSIQHVASWLAQPPSAGLDDEGLAAALAEAEADLRAWADDGSLARVDLGEDGAVTAIDLSRLLPPGVPQPAVHDVRSLADALRSVERALGGAIWIGDEFDEGDRLAATLWVGREVRDKVGVVLRLFSVAGPLGVTILLAAESRLLAPVAAAVPVSLGGRRDAVSLESAR